MQTRTWSTLDAATGTELAYWSGILAETMIEMEVRCESDGFAATLMRNQVGPIAMSRVRVSTAQQLSRSRTAIARSAIEQFGLIYILKGSAIVEHVGCEIDLRAGDCVLLDSRQPHRFQSSASSDGLCFHVPVEWLASRMPKPELALGRRISKATPWGAALIAALAAVESVDDESMKYASDLCADQIAGALCLASSTWTSKTTMYGHGIYQRVLETLHASVHEHDLRAAKIAKECGISVRYLHSLFAGHSTTYGSQLLRIKLERAARMLRDPLFRHISVGEIGYKAGFLEPSHFSRRFKDAFSQTPAVFRTMAIGDTAK